MKLTEATGVDLGWSSGGGILRLEGFPYNRFLKNSNEEVKERIRKFFQSTDVLIKQKSDCLKAEDFGL